MVLSEAYRELMQYYNLPERFRAGDFVLTEEEAEILREFVDGFYDSAEKNGYVSLGELTEFMSLLEVLCGADSEEVRAVLAGAFLRSGTLWNKLHDQITEKDLFVVHNETMQSILARRSYQLFDSRPIDAEALRTIVTAGLYAPSGMNRQPWHITVLQSRKALERFGAARRALPLPPGIPAELAAAMGDPMRNAPVMILVSAREGGTSLEDSCLAMENMFIAAASLGIMSGWDHATVKELFRHDPALKAELIPEGYALYAAAFFGYPGPSVKDRGQRKGTVDYL